MDRELFDVLKQIISISGIAATEQELCDSFRRSIFCSERSSESRPQQEPQDQDHLED